MRLNQASYHSPLLDGGGQKIHLCLVGQAITASVVTVERQNGVAKGAAQFVDDVHHANLNAADAKSWENVKDGNRV